MFAQRLDKVLEEYGFCSNRSCSCFLKNNEIELNGKKIGLKEVGREQKCLETEIAVLRKTLVDTQIDELFVNGKKVVFFDHQYIVLNKPQGYVCSSVSDMSTTVYELLALSKYFSEIINEKPENERIYIEKKLHSVGRLDKETEGLLLFSTNTTFSHFFTSPQSNVEKTYFVELKKSVSQSQQAEYSEKCALRLLLPAEKKAGKCYSRPAKLLWKDSTHCEITVTEGKFHEVRRIFLALGNEVQRLKRIAFAGFCLPDSLLPGECRSLYIEEIEHFNLIFSKNNNC